MSGRVSSKSFVRVDGSLTFYLLVMRKSAKSCGFSPLWRTLLPVLCRAMLSWAACMRLSDVTLPLTPAAVLEETSDCSSSRSNLRYAPTSLDVTLLSALTSDWESNCERERAPPGTYKLLLAYLY